MGAQLYESERGQAVVGLTGDSLITRPWSVFDEPRFLALRDLIRSAEAAITNAEMLFHDYESPPTFIPGGTYMRAAPAILAELRWMGFNMVAAANNHSYDFGENGVLTNLRNLKASGLVHAGTGANMAEARSPAYLETRKGRVALVSLTTSGPPNLYAGHQTRDHIGRPGASMVRQTSEFTVKADVFESLWQLNKELKLATVSRVASLGYRNHTFGASALPDTDDEFFMGPLQNIWQYPVPEGCRIRRGDRFAHRLIPEPNDLAEVVAAVNDARRMADIVVVSVHNHEHGATHRDPSDAMKTIAHAVIDAGAHIVHGHGPHRDRGIEIYRGRPIFYSLGHFVFENETVARVPFDNLRRQGLDPWQSTPADFSDARSGKDWADEWLGLSDYPPAWRDVVAMVHFSGGEPARVELHPIDLGFKRPRSQRGRPMMAEGDVADAVLRLFQDLSAPFGTKVQIEGTRGVIQIQ